MRIMLEMTDEMHGITMKEIIAELRVYGIPAGRKSIYNDIENLRECGIDIISIQKNRTYYYYVGNRQFELAELKLLVDAVQVSKSITVKKTNELIKKLEALTSKYEAAELQRQVYVRTKVKTKNENIYYNIDRIYTAIGKNSRITFHYVQWNVKKEIEFCRNGELYEVSPWALYWNNERYYLIGYDSKEKRNRHYCIDKMLHTEIINVKREGKNKFCKFETVPYEEIAFDIKEGKRENVKIECDNSLAGVMIDWFGKDVLMIRKDSEHFIINVKVIISRPFLSWIIALGEEARVISPENVINMINDEIDRLICQYKK